MLRALLLARKHKIACIGYGERTTLTISMNAFVREYMLYMKITKKKQLILLAVYTAVFWIGTSLLQQYSPEQVMETGQIVANWLAG